MIEPAILSFGEVLWDLFPDGECFGGAPANFASHAAILGGSVRIVSAVGDDGHGRGAVEVLRSHGVDTQLVQTDSLIAIALGGACVRVPAQCVADAQELIAAFHRGDLALDDDFDGLPPPG